MEETKRETRKEVIALCELLGGSMMENSELFILRGYAIDLSATHTDFLGKVVMEQLEEKLIDYGKFLKTKEIKKALKI